MQCNVCLNNCNDFHIHSAFHSISSFSHFKLNHKLSFCRCEFLKFVSLSTFLASLHSIRSDFFHSIDRSVCRLLHQVAECKPRVFCFAIISRVFITFHTVAGPFKLAMKWEKEQQKKVHTFLTWLIIFVCNIICHAISQNCFFLVSSVLIEISKSAARPLNNSTLLTDNNFARISINLSELRPECLPTSSRAQLTQTPSYHYGERLMNHKVVI